MYMELLTSRGAMSPQYRAVLTHSGCLTAGRCRWEQSLYVHGAQELDSFMCMNSLEPPNCLPNLAWENHLVSSFPNRYFNSDELLPAEMNSKGNLGERRKSEGSG